MEPAPAELAAGVLGRLSAFGAALREAAEVGVEGPAFDCGAQLTEEDASAATSVFTAEFQDEHFWRQLVGVSMAKVAR